MTDTIHRAAERGDLEAVHRFVEVEGIDVDCNDEGGDTPLNVAVRSTTRNNALIIWYLISKNANVEELPESDNTALMVASHNGFVNAAKILLEEGHANVNARNRYDSTALIIATGNPKGFCVVSTLLQHGACFSQSTGRCLLRNACCYPRSAAVVQQLLEYGASAMDASAMHNAAQYSDGATIRLLIARGADANKIRYCGSTPLIAAINNSNASTVRALLEHDAKVGVTISYEQGLLHIVKDDTICGILLDHCRTTLSEDEFHSFLMKADSSQNIALYYARSIEIAQLLVEQPRCRDQLLSPTCHAQLVWENRIGSRYHGMFFGKVGYLETFESLALSVPGGERVNDDIAVMMNPALNEFQRSVAEEALGLIMTTTGCPDSIAHGMLGYLSALDVMKRTERVSP